MRVYKRPSGMLVATTFLSRTLVFEAAFASNQPSKTNQAKSTQAKSTKQKQITQ
jgi:hypothetical protein